MDRPIGNDNKIHRSLEGALGYIYIEYTTYTPSFPKKTIEEPANMGKTRSIVNQGKELVIKTR